MKKIIYIVIVIIIAWIGIKFFISGSDDAWICENDQWIKYGNPSDSKPDTPCNDSVLVPSIETKNITESNDEKRYEINVDLPIINNVNNYEKINTFIQGKVDEVVSKFKENIDDWEVPSNFDSEMKSGLWISFEEHFLDNSHLSLRLTVSEYLIGVAHPNNYSFSLNYNLEKLAEIKLDSLFSVDQQEYLFRISGLALIDLKDQFVKLDMDPESMMFDTGLEPELKNFSNFNITKEGIIFNFDQYQIAPYAAGEFHVIIPHEKLVDIMNKVY